MSKPSAKYFIQEHLQEPYLNGGVGYTDVERILQQEQYKAIFFPCHYSHSFFSKLRRSLFLVRTFVSLPSHATVVFLYPQYAGMTKLLVRMLAWRKQIKRVAIIGDINGLRYGDEEKLQQELQQFAGYDFLILHNQVMEQWLKHRLTDTKTAVLHYFDFLTTPQHKPATQNKVVAYAGNLAESPFLKRLNELLPANKEVVFNVYGQPFTPDLLEQHNLQYMGVSEPYGLPAKLEGAYGLIWDGNGLGESEDSIADYLRYISPHRASLYILSGKPIIVQKDAGIAAMVAEQQIGILLDSLHNIQSVIEAVSAEHYALMSANCQKLATVIAAGNGLRSALAEMEKALT